MGNNWPSNLDRVFVENPSKFRKYDGCSVQDFLRALWKVLWNKENSRPIVLQLLSINPSQYAAHYYWYPNKHGSSTRHILGMPWASPPIVNVWTQQCTNRWCLNDVMLVRMEECISRDRLIIVGIISSHFRQYSRKAEDFQHPCTIMTKGSTPISSRCVVPPIQKLWPVTECSPERAHTLLHRSMNQVRDMGTGFPASLSKANSAAVFGMLSLIHKWFLNAHSVLQGQPESVHIMSCPSGDVFV